MLEFFVGVITGATIVIMTACIITGADKNNETK